MLIANPIYDTFFKYLLEDVKLAKILLSAIIEEDIISLELRPQELIIDVPEKYLSILRVDFKAIIRTPDGKTKKILIEMQKSRVLFDIMRFRKYLADNYGREDEIISHDGNKTEVLPIITIYFLNFKLKNIKFPVLKIDRIYNNVITKKVTKVKENFIEQLTHDCYAIQIPRLQINMQNKLEKLLSIFNQTYVTTKDQKVLNLPPEWEQDEILGLFIEKMNKPLLSHDMLRKAEAEEEVGKIFEKLDRDMLKVQEKLYKAEKQKDEAEKQKDEAEKQKDEAEKQKDEAEKQKDEAEKQKDEAEKQKDEAEKQKDEAEKQKDEAEKQKDEAEKQKDEAEKQKDEAEKQKDEAEKQKDEAEKQKNEAEKQKNEAEKKLILLEQNQVDAVLKMLGTKSLTVEQIAEFLNISVEKVLEIQLLL